MKIFFEKKHYLARKRVRFLGKVVIVFNINFSPDNFKTCCVVLTSSVYSFYHDGRVFIHKFNIYLYGTDSDTARRLCSLQRIRNPLQLSPTRPPSNAGSFRISHNMKTEFQHKRSFLVDAFCETKHTRLLQRLFSPDHRPHTERSIFYRTSRGLPTLLESNLRCFQRVSSLLKLFSLLDNSGLVLLFFLAVCLFPEGGIFCIQLDDEMPKGSPILRFSALRDSNFETLWSFS